MLARINTLVAVSFLSVPKKLSSTLFVTPNDWLSAIARLILSLVVGGIIGWERELRHKPAGLRTHMLVSFASALFVTIPILLGGAQTEADSVARVIQGIAAGVGFLGAGEIIRTSVDESKVMKVRGLTSAAAIWVSAALGVAVGCGFWQIGLISALLCVLVLTVVKKFERNF